ncbi:histidine kinase dimerization/phosphoacceptor domain -containing protein [Neptunicoccus sediminis]|uniref:histidine kinase dimerization/phosphoacceptor domain -containing protein n=1 Tax=Neptunicoccus sediminis TaxID=1892596 RepID=UPI0009F64EB4|nr:histidine kinase dimerization/phosphoacceptor domain -containing protein [Neptunicoccus sediminis]
MLDTEAEADFDDIVELASNICDVPVSLISLVDDNRQWFKSRKGFGPEETPLDQSVCAHAILESSFLEVEDMASDPRTADNPLHTGDPRVNFYAGANLVAPNGMPIGTLCVLDTKPRKLTDFQRQALQTLSRQVVTQLELRKRLNTETALRSEMDHRVKNSLQTIASITRVASRKITDPQSLDVLRLIERRIGAVASLHTELMGQEGRSSVEARGYLERVAALLKDVSPDHVTVKVQSVETHLDAQKASAIGMIASEFLANSIKHAFPDNRSGQVDVILERIDETHLKLTCRDDGIGRNTSPSVETRDTGLGEMLMSAAAAQLGSRVSETSNLGGTKLCVKFTG